MVRVCFIYVLIILTGISAQKCPDKFTACPPPKIQAALESSILLMCRTKDPIETCLWDQPVTEKSQKTDPKNIRPLPEDEYYIRENPEDDRSCDLRIKSVRDVDHGNWTCNPLPKDAVTVIYSTPVYVEVAQPPTPPYIHFEDHAKPAVIQVSEKEIVSIGCHVESSRPEARLYWYIGNYAKMLIEKNITSSAQTTVALLDLGNNLVKTTSMVTSAFQAEHNSKQIWCKVDHIALTAQQEDSAYTILDVLYTPKFNSTATENVFPVNSKAVVDVFFTSNPMPEDPQDVKVTIDGRESVVSGSKSSDGTVAVARPERQQGSSDTYFVSITFESLTTELTKQDYILSVTNRVYQPVMHKIVVQVEGSGEQDTHPYGLAAGIILGVSLLVAGILTYYAWTKSKWCFKPDEHKRVPTQENQMKDMGQHSNDRQNMNQRPMA